MNRGVGIGVTILVIGAVDVGLGQAIKKDPWNDALPDLQTRAA